jgi:hypothetical protein
VGEFVKDATQSERLNIVLDAEKIPAALNELDRIARGLDLLHSK